VQDATGTFDDTPLMREWNRIRIVAAFGSREEEVLRGFIRQIRAEYPEDAGAAKLVVECQDESLQLDREHRRTSWGSEDLPTSDQQIVDETLARYAGLGADPMNAAGQTGIVGLNQDGTDITLLQARAEENGYELYFRRGVVYFGPPRAGLPQPQPTLSVYAGKSRQLHLDHRHRRRPPARRSRLRSAGRNRRRVERSDRRARSAAARY
jgi:hypothetical protein